MVGRWERGGTALVLLLASCTARTGDRPQDLKVVERTIHSSISWALTKNKPLLDSCFTHDPDLLIYNPYGLDPNLGFGRLEEAWKEFWSKDDFRATRFEMRNLRIVFSRDGNVAWYAAVMDDEGEWQGQPAGWLDTRWTGVLERREGRWVIVQQHYSFAAHPAGGSGS